MDGGVGVLVSLCVWKGKGNENEREMKEKWKGNENEREMKENGNEKGN